MESNIDYPRLYEAALGRITELEQELRRLRAIIGGQPYRSEWLGLTGDEIFVYQGEENHTVGMSGVELKGGDARET